MIIAFACDHGGFTFRESVIHHLEELGHTIIDLGAQSIEPLDDFPEFAAQVSRSVQDATADRWVLICGTGIGMCIGANRFTWVNAAVLYSPEIATIARKHNDVNVACFGGRTMQIEEVLQSLDIFLTEPFLWGKYEKRGHMIDENGCRPWTC
jgi:ribose 5-phosphate isomerase B